MFAVGGDNKFTLPSCLNLFGFNSPLLAAKAVRRTAAFALGVDTPQLAAGRFIS
jgi:hypothetical protein